MSLSLRGTTSVEDKIEPVVDDVLTPNPVTK
jgi:hypothetical protein